MKYLFLLLMVSAANANTKVDDWYYNSGTKGEYTFSVAGTKDAYSSQLYILCVNNGKTDCFTAVNLNLQCEPGKTYAVLVSHVNGSQGIEATCAQLFGATMLTLPSQEEHIVNGNVYSIVMAKESGSFKSAHFSLKGSAKAYQEIIMAVGRAANAGNIL